MQDGTIVMVCRRVNAIGAVDGLILLPGVPDASFGSEGIQVVLLGEPFEIARGLAVQRSGKVLLSGQVVDQASTWLSNGVVMRLPDA